MCVFKNKKCKNERGIVMIGTIAQSILKNVHRNLLTLAAGGPSGKLGKMKPQEKDGLIEGLAWLLSGEDIGKLDDVIPGYDGETTWIGLLTDIFWEHVSRINESDIREVYEGAINSRRRAVDKENKSSDNSKDIPDFKNATDLVKYLHRSLVKLKPKMDAETRADIFDSRERSKALSMASKVGKLRINPVGEGKSESRLSEPSMIMEEPKRKELTHEEKVKWGDRLVNEARKANPDIKVFEDAERQGFDFNFNEPQCAIISAASHNHLWLVKWLVDRGVDVNIKNRRGFTALYMAASYGHEEVVEWLLEHKADPNTIGVDGFAPLHAIWCATIDKSKRVGILRLLLKYHANIDVQDSQGATTLAMAANHGDMAVVEFLLEHGADKNLKDSKGRTPRDRAAVTKSISDEKVRERMMRLLSVDSYESEEDSVSISPDAIEEQITFKRPRKEESLATAAAPTRADESEPPVMNAGAATAAAATAGVARPKRPRKKASAVTTAVVCPSSKESEENIKRLANWNNELECNFVYAIPIFVGTGNERHVSGSKLNAIYAVESPRRGGRRAKRVYVRFMKKKGVREITDADYAEVLKKVLVEVRKMIDIVIKNDREMIDSLIEKWEKKRRR